VYNRVILACLLILPITCISGEQVVAPATSAELLNSSPEDLMKLIPVKMQYENELKYASVKQFYANMSVSAIVYNCGKPEISESVMQGSDEVRDFIEAKTASLIQQKPEYKEIEKLSKLEKDDITVSVFVHLNGYWLGYKDAASFTIKLHPEICGRAIQEANFMLASKKAPSHQK